MALKVGELFASFSIDTSGVSGAVDQIEQSCNNLGSSMMRSGAGLTAAVTAPVVKAAKDMYTAGTDFEAQMSKVQAIAGLDTQVEADAAAIKALTDEALHMGSTTEWTAKQAGEALEYMAMAGWKTDNMLAALPQVMNLATAAGADLGTTSDIVTDAMTAFGLKATDMVKVTKDGIEQEVGAVQYFTDILAKTSSSANTNVELLGESFKFVAPLAGAYGYSLNDVATALGLMANNGIKGSMAGTSLSRVIQNITKPSDNAAAAMDRLGISLVNNDGSMKSLSQIMGDFRKAAAGNQADIEKMTKQVNKLTEQFNSGKLTEEQYEAALNEINDANSGFLKDIVQITGARGLPGLLAIMNASDEDFNYLTNQINNATGATDLMAETMRDNAKGAVTKLKSAVEGLEITLWGLVSGSFKKTIEKVTTIVDKFRAMDEKTQKTILKFLALSAAAGPVLVIAGKLIKMLPTLVKAISALASPMGLVAAGLGLFAVAAVDADNTIGRSMENMAKKARDKLNEFGKTITDKISAVGDRMPALVQSIINSIDTLVPDLFEIGTKIITGIMDAITKNADSLADLGTTIITTLVNGIADALPSLIPSAVNMIATLAAAIIENIPELATAALNLIDGFKEAIINIDFKDIGKKILTAIENAISGLDQVFTNWFTKSSEKAKSLDWASIGSKIVELILTSTTKIVEFAGNMIGNICDALNNHNWSEDAEKLKSIAESLMTGIKDAIPKVANVAVNIVKAIASLFTKEGAATQIATAAIDIAKTLISGIVDCIPTLSNAAVDIINEIGNLFVGEKETGGLADGAINIATSLMTSITEAIPKVASGIAEIAKALIDNIVKVLPTAFEQGGKIISAGMKIASEIIKSISESFDNINIGNIDFTSIVQGLINGITEAISNFPKLVGDVLSVGAQIANKLMESLADAFQDTEVSGIGGSFGTTLANLVSGLLGAITNFASNPDVLGFVENLGKGIIAALGTIGETVGSFVGTLLKNMFTEEGLTKIYNAGKSIIELLIKGIEAGISGIFRFAFNAIDGILEGLGIIDPDVKKAYKEALATAEQMKGVVQDAFADGFYWDEGDINVGDVNDAILQALSLKLTGAEWDEGAFQELALSIKDKISTHIGNEFMDDDAAGYHFEGIINGLTSNLVNAANTARLEEGTFSGLNVEAILGPFLDEFGAGAKSVSPELYDTIAKYLLEGGFENENELFAMILEQVIGDTNSAEAQQVVDNTEQAVQAAFVEITGVANEAATKTQGEIDGITISWDAVFTSSLASVGAWQTELEAALTKMGVSAGSLLGVALPDGVAQGLAEGKITVEQAADAIVKAATATEAQIAKTKEENKATGKETGEKLGEGEESAKGTVETASQNLAKAAEVPFEELAESVKASGVAGITGLAGAITDNQETVVNAAETVSDAVVQKFLAEMSEDTGKTIGKTYVDGLVSGMKEPDVATESKKIADVIVDTFKGIMSSDNSGTIGNNFIVGIRNKFYDSTLLTSITTGAKDIAKRVVDTFKNVMSTNNANILGRNFSIGVANGIIEKANLIYDTARKVAANAVKAAKKELGIHSPSKIARDEIGLMYDMGIVEGLEDGIKQVKLTAKNVSDSLHDSFYVGDTSRGTVQTAKQNAETNGAATARYINTSNIRQGEISRDGIAEAIRSGMNGIVFILNGEAVGNAVAPTVSQYIGEESLSRS